MKIEIYTYQVNLLVNKGSSSDAFKSASERLRLKISLPFLVGMTETSNFAVHIEVSECPENFKPESEDQVFSFFFFQFIVIAYIAARLILILR